MLRLFIDGSLNAVKLRIHGSSVIKTMIGEPQFPDNNNRRNNFKITFMKYPNEFTAHTAFFLRK